MKIIFRKIIEASPSAPEPLSLAFVEVEDDQGNGINAVEWLENHCVLHISNQAHIDALRSFPLELDERNQLEQLLATQSTPRLWQRLTPDEQHVLETYRKAKPLAHDKRGWHPNDEDEDFPG